MTTLRDFFKEPVELLRLEPEELAGILIEVIPGVSQQSGFVIEALAEPLFPPSGGGFARSAHNDVVVALAEAMAWMVAQGLLIRNSHQPAHWMLLTRRGRGLKTRADVEAYRKGNALPIQLLQPHLAEKVHHLFVRGDHDVAVFQAFKTLEVAVRKAGGYDNTVIGKRLVTRAFNSDDGPLRNTEATQDEREAEMALFVGAIGHCKNPTSHRDVDLGREEAARLIVFASHLLAIVEERAAALGG